jgi:hypothetical protein
MRMSDQGDFDFNRTHARRRDPSTSHEAAAQAKDLANGVVRNSNSDLFDKAEAERRRDIAIERVGSTLDASRWVTRALPVVRRIAETVPQFTTDRIEYELEQSGIAPPPEKRALGPLMRKAASLGWIEITDRTVKSIMPSNHRRPKAVWRSRLLSGTECDFFD